MRTPGSVYTSVNIFMTLMLSAVIACGGGKSSDGSGMELLLLVGGDNQAWDDSADGGVTVNPPSETPPAAPEVEEPAPPVVIDPLRAEAEAILGVSLENTECAPLRVPHVLHHSKIGACVYQNQSKTYVKWSGIYTDFYFNERAICEALPGGVYTVHGGNAVAEYGMNQCYGGYLEPEDPNPLELHSILAMNGHTSGGNLAIDPFESTYQYYPETMYFHFQFNQPLCISPEDSDNTNNVQLWKKQDSGSWAQVAGVYPHCSGNTLRLYFKDYNGFPPLNWAVFDYELDEYSLEPDSTYRILLSAKLHSSYHQAANSTGKFGIINARGSINPDGQWAGIEFRTSNAPCFESYHDRWPMMGRACIFTKHQNGHLVDFGCAMQSWPGGDLDNGASFDEACGPDLFPEVDFTSDDNQIRKLYGCDPHPYMDPNDYDNHWHNIHNNPVKDLKEFEGTQGCVLNARTPHEMVRMYIPNHSSEDNSTCDGLPRDSVPYYNGTGKYGPDEYYSMYRRAACEGRPPEPEPDPGQGCVESVNLMTDNGNWFQTPDQSFINSKGRKIKISGIHTYWENEKLGLEINACRTGWYRLSARAINIYGPKPDFYGAYHLNLVSQEDGRKYGLSIKADEEQYRNGSTFVFLYEGQNKIDATWTNDAYLENVYDANLQLKQVNVAQYDGTPPKVSSTSKAARDFCEMEGRFFGQAGSIYTDRPGQNVGYCFTDLEAGEYRLVVSAKNHGDAPEGFESFRVRIQNNDAVAGFMDIPVSSVNYQKGQMTFNVFNERSDIRLSWINDHAPGESAEARFELKNVRIKRLGPNTESQLTAYMKAASPQKILMLLLLSVLTVGLVYLARRRFGRVDS